MYGIHTLTNGIEMKRMRVDKFRAIPYNPASFFPRNASTNNTPLFLMIIIETTEGNNGKERERILLIIFLSIENLISFLYKKYKIANIPNVM